MDMHARACPCTYYTITYKVTCHAIINIHLHVTFFLAHVSVYLYVHNAQNYYNLMLGDCSITCSYTLTCHRNYIRSWVIHDVYMDSL